MTKLNQIIAVANGKKSSAKSKMTEAYQISQKPELFNGLERNYEPINDDGAQLPSESKKVQFTVNDLVDMVEKPFVEMVDTVVTQDAANQEASANVEVNGQIVAEKVPVSSLIFLEKQLTDINTFISKFPTLDTAEDWTLDPNSGYNRSNENKTHRLEKVVEPIVLYDATPEHPAQTQMATVDKLAGYWKTIKLSGAISRVNRDRLLEKVKVLKESVVKARENANSIEVQNKNVGESIFNYIFQE